MKHLFVLGSFYPAQTGGPSNSIYWLGGALVESGHEVSVAALCDGITPQLLEEHELCLDSKNLVGGIASYYFSYSFSRHFCLRLMLWLWKNIREYDQVNLTSVFFSGSILACILCRVRGVPFTIAPRGELIDSALTFGRLKKRLFWKFCGRRLFSSARFVLATSNEERVQSTPFFRKGTEFRQLPNYISVPEIELTDDEILRKKTILFLGRLHPIKGIERLIMAYDTLDSELAEKYRLQIAGSGQPEYEHSLKLLAAQSRYSSKIEFLGHVRGPQKEAALRQARVLVLPSYSENYGNVVPEALARFTPVVASSGTPWSMLEERNCGLTVVNEVEALAAAMSESLSQDPLAFLASARDCRKFAEQELSITTNRVRAEAELC